MIDRTLAAFSLLLAGMLYAGGAEYWTVPDPTADDGVCRIYTLGHSFYAGDDDLVGLLPRMLQHQKGWKVEIGGHWSQGGWAARQILVDNGHHKVEDLRFCKDIKGWLEIKEAIPRKKYDLILFLNGTGGFEAEANNHGSGMLSERYYANALHKLAPQATIIGLGVWASPSSDYERFAQECDLNLAAWRGAAGAESQAQIIFDLKRGSNDHPSYSTLRKAWGEIGNIERFIVAPVAEAWKIAYAEKGVGGDFVLHRSIVNRDSHGNLWGDYLKTCVHFSMITGEKFNGAGFTETITSPGHNKAIPSENKTYLPDNIARYLEDVAWRTVQHDRIAMSNLLNGRPAGVPPIKSQVSVVRSRVEQTFNAKMQITQLKRSGQTERRQYGDDGSLTRREIVSPTGDVIQVRVFKPEMKDGKKVAIHQQDGEGKLIGREIFEWNDDGTLKSEKIEDRRGNVDATYTYRYEAERRAEKKFFNAAGKLESTTTYSYENGRLARATEVERRGRKTTVQQYHYASAPPEAELESIRTGSTVKRFGYDSRGNKNREAVYRVDDSGNEVLISEITYVNSYSN